MIALILIPCVLYVTLYLIFSRGLINEQWLRRGNLAGAALAALLALASVLLILRFATDWSAKTQVEWTGFEVVGQPLVVGGPRDEAVVAWPNESFSPALKVKPRDEHTATIEISGSDAFLYDEKKSQFLNGHTIPVGTTKTLGDFTVRLSRVYTLWQRIEILDANNEVWVSFDLPTALIRRDRVYALAERVDSFASKTVRDNPAQLVRLEQWADKLHLLLTRAGEIRLLDDKPESGECEFPCKLQLRRINRTVPFELTRDGAKLSLCYPPPRQLISSLPPAGPNGMQMIVTSDPRPGDIAFSIPIGHGIEDPRKAIQLERDSSGLVVISTPGAIQGESRRSSYLPDSIAPPISRPCSENDITSRLFIQSGNTIFDFATVADLPSLRLLALLSLLAFVSFFCGLLLSYARMPDDRTRFVLYSLAVICWSLLCVRLLLALRYAISPSNLDFLVVKGVTTALVGLAVVPGLVLLLSRFKRDVFSPPATAAAKKKALALAIAYVIFLFGAAWVEYSKAATLWVDLPARFQTIESGSLTSVVVLSLLAALVLYFVLVIFALYKTVPGASAARKRVVRIVLWPFGDTFGRIIRRGAIIWNWASTDTSWPWITWAAFVVFSLIVVPLVIAVLSGVLSMFVAGLSKLVPLETFFHDIIVPFGFFWPVALTWLAIRLSSRPGSTLPQFRRLLKNPSLTRRLLRTFLLAVGTVSSMVFLVPVIINDVGSILAGTAIMVPAAIVLMAARPRRWGAVVLLAVVLGFSLAAYFYVNIHSISPFLPERVQVAASRLLVFKEGNNIQKYMPFTATYGGQLQKLRDGYQHTWENQSISHEGGIVGLGFGNAPTQKSQVRQDTLQYDSVFSFFIVSEHGLLGGLALLVVYSLPLVIVLIGAKTRMDFGYGVATVITSSLLLEALTHAAMNFDLLPFTGRDLPWVTVNSVTDLLRWTILLCIVAFAVLNRYRGVGLRQDAEVGSILTPPTPLVANSTEPFRSYLPGVILMAAIPAVLFIGVAAAGISLYRDVDNNLGAPFSWSGILEVIDGMAREGLIVVKSDQTLAISPQLRVSPGMLVEQEIARFNALLLEERVGEAGFSNYGQQLGRARNRSEYEHVLDDIRRADLGYDRASRRISLFKLLPPFKWNDGGRIREVGGYRLVANREFNSQISFKVGLTDSDISHTTFSDGRGWLIGPAWVRGKWVQTVDHDSSLPWTGHLAGVLQAEWDRLGKTEAAKRYGKLTLDRSLEEAANVFASMKGWALHNELLVNGSPGSTLPPRVALTILSLPTGQIVALGGWPRMTSSPFWVKSSDRREWIPPARWVERDAPQHLRNIYEGDRNFDRMVMGSATKPLWAAAVLSIHPNLDQKLSTRGIDEEESDVFGIKIPVGWDVHPSGNWTDFRNYLAQSDNRYQVRLGFLGLSERVYGDVTDAGQSSSDRESLRGSPPQPWHRFPKFPPEINFSHVQAGPFRRLEETPLAKSLNNMFSFGVTSDFSDYRRSLWTKSEADDLNTSIIEQRRLTVFNAISPQAVDLSLDRVSAPRDYITLLLGGGTNLWANTDFAAAFATCVTGHPTLAHIVANDINPAPLPERKSFPEIAAKLRPGLMGVLTDGTGRVQELTSGLSRLNKTSDIKIYAKTGTLSDRPDAINTSRIVVAIIRWEDEKKGTVKNGLILSLVVERGGMATSSKWLGEFIATYHSDLERMLGK